jgi:hypothetical protein
MKLFVAVVAGVLVSGMLPVAGPGSTARADHPRAAEPGDEPGDEDHEPRRA